MANYKYIFDVDGTLTPSRGKIDPQFARWFIDFCAKHAVYLVTGSDYSKTKEQLGEELLQLPVTVYNCSGNDVWQQGVRIRTNHWSMPDEVREFLAERLKASEFVLRTGEHFDVRPGSVNFSIVGRGATLKERALYKEWDQHTGERNRLVCDFDEKFGADLEIAAGGETGVDIYPRGRNKSQILEDFDQHSDVVLFFGDCMEPRGNDFELAHRLRHSGWQGKNYSVADWQHTWCILQELHPITG